MKKTKKRDAVYAGGTFLSQGRGFYFPGCYCTAQGYRTEHGDYIIQNWKCNSNTIEFDGIKKQHEFNSFLINIECLVTEARTQNTDRIENS